MVGGLGYLGAGLGGISQGYSQGYDQSLEQAGQAALGRTLQMLGQAPQMQPMPQGPQPPMGGMPPQQPPPQMGGQVPNQQGSPPIGVQPPGGAAPPMPQQRTGAPPIGQPAMSAGQPPAAMPPQGGQGQPQSQPQPTGWGQQGGGGQQQGPLDWRQIIQAVQAANPGAPPQVLAAAVNHAIPLMNSQAQMEWKQVMSQIAGERVSQGQQRIDQGYARMDNQTAIAVARINNDRQKNLLPPLTPQEMEAAGMIPPGGGGGQPQQAPPQQPSGPASMGANSGERQLGDKPLQAQPGQPEQQPKTGGQYPEAVGYLMRQPQQTRELMARIGWDAATLDQAADVYKTTGKTPTMTGMRGPAAAAVQSAIRGIAQQKAANEGMTNAQMMSGWQKFHAEGKFQDTAATYGARVENAVNELKQLIPQAAAASDQYNRSDVVALNDLYNKWKQGTSDPRFNDLLIASFGTISAYVRAMNPAGTPRVADRLETEAIKLLSTSVSKEAYMTQLRRMWKEAQASQTATYETGKEGRKPGDINAPMPGDTGGDAIPQGWTVRVH